MTTGSPGERAIGAYEIDDVFLVESVCTVDREFNQTQLIGEIETMQRIYLDPQILLQTRTLADETKSETYFIRYYVKGEVYFLKKESTVKQDASEVPESDTYARVSLTFAADYKCNKEHHAERDAIAAFGRNAVFHVWPYWREGLHECVARMRLPRVTIPMLKPPPHSATGGDSTRETAQPQND